MAAALAIRAAKSKRVREVILELLQMEYPQFLDEKVLFYALDDLGLTLLKQDFDAQMQYLCEKGYVRREERGVKDLKVVLYGLTAFGMDVLEGTREDGGIGVGEKDL